MRINLNELRRIIYEAMLNAYDVLGLPHNASDDEIKKAWRNLAIQNHPDRGGSHGKMVDINNAKDRLLDKTNLFRYGPNFKGYDDPNAPKAPDMSKCGKCGRNVSIKDGKLVGHYTEQGGSVRCEGSFKAPAQAAPPPPRGGGYGRNPEDDFWDYVRRRAQEQERNQPPPPPPPRPNPPRDGGEWRASRERPGYEYNNRTGDYRRQSGYTGASGAPPPPPPRPNAPPPGGDPRGAAANPRRYLTFIGGRSRKFWEVERVGRTLYVRWGRIGSPGYTKPYTYATEQRAQSSMQSMVQGKLDKGYVAGVPPQGPSPSAAAGAAPPGAAPGPAPAGGAPGPAAGAAGGRPEPSGRPTQDSYKVYGWRQGRRVVRVGGKLYGTGPGGNLPGGGQTRFNSNDRARVTRDGTRMKVKQQGGDHTQTWDPIDQVDEVRQVVVDLVMEMFQRIAEET